MVCYAVVLILDVEDETVLGREIAGCEGEYGQVPHTLLPSILLLETLFSEVAKGRLRLRLLLGLQLSHVLVGEPGLQDDQVELSWVKRIQITKLVIQPRERVTILDVLLLDSDHGILS